MANNQKSAENPVVETKKSEKELIKVAHFHTGVHLLGGKQSFLATKTEEIEAVPGIGIKITSLTSKRVVIVPFSNCTGYELVTKA